MNERWIVTVENADREVQLERTLYECETARGYASAIVDILTELGNPNEWKVWVTYNELSEWLWTLPAAEWL